MLKQFVGGLLAALILIPTAVMAKIADDAESVSPLMNGQTVPDVQVKDLQGTAISLLELSKQKPTVIIFYRGGWCPFCNAQLSGLQEIESKLAKMGYQLLAISPDTPAQLAETSKDRELGYQLLSDRSLAASQGFGLAFYLDDKTAERYRGKMGAVFASEQGDDRIVLPVPAVYVVDQQGLVQFNYVHPNYKVRIQPELLLKAAELALHK
ncbi:peroxiredoxin-like family protein [Corallincola spongiicola]|nr:peroxiredoxin-like family protein [Corallincola spongiicola]TAA47452.1 AhpC/TSA family protein [Corallincola spongiicola]